MVRVIALLGLTMLVVPVSLNLRLYDTFSEEVPRAIPPAEPAQGSQWQADIIASAHIPEAGVSRGSEAGRSPSMPTPPPARSTARPDAALPAPTRAPTFTATVPAGEATQSGAEEAQPIRCRAAPADTLPRLAQRLAAAMGGLVELNALAGEGEPVAYQWLLVPGGGKEVHTVEPGESLSAIAMAYGTTASRIAELNGLADDEVIIAGECLAVPDLFSDEVAEGRQ